MKVNMPKYKKLGRNVNISLIPSDIYSFDRTLARIILPGLLMIREHGHGIPSHFADVGGEDYTSQLSFDFYKEEVNELFEQVACKRWRDTLDKMIWSFQQLVEDNYHDQYSYGEPEFSFEEDSEGSPNGDKWYKMVDNNPTEHWIDFEGLAEHENRIQEGLDLFGKHYLSLWT